MKNFINFFLIITAFTLFLYSCGEDTTPTQSNNTNNAPTKPQNPFPADSSINVSIGTVMVVSWQQCTDPDAGDTVKYDLYVGNSLPLGNTPIVSDLINPSHGLGILQAGTDYYWKVTAKDNHGATNSSNVWRFRTQN